MAELINNPRKGAPPAPGTGLHRLAEWLWRALVIAVVLLAVYVSVGRFAMGNVSALREWLLEEVNGRLPFSVEVSRIAGAWTAFSPEFVFDQLTITQPGGEGAPVQVGRGRLRLDLPGSLSSGSLQLSHLELEGLALNARLTAEGNFELEGFETGSSGTLQRWLSDFLPRVRRVSLLENDIALSGLGESKNLRADLSLTRERNARRLQGQISGEGLRLRVHADGVGNPLQPLSWSGDVFVDVASDDLADFESLWDSLDWPFTISGSSEAQFWLSRSDGDSEARLRLDSTAVRIDERGGAWSLPLDALAFEADLSQRRNHWALLAEDFHAERDGRSLDLARVQFEWWGSALRLRASELGLDSLPTLLAAAPGLPQGLREVLPVLAPSGRLESLELRLDDLSAPGQSWSLRSLLDGVAVESWRGAPALAGVSGYLELAPGRGELQLDSGPFTMHFPKIYDEPMHYDRAWGDLGFDWDASGLQIRSGLVRTQGEEGEVRAIFTVDLPFSQRNTGPEMAVLAGLQNTQAQHRHKYIPTVLPPTLLNWLDSSVKEGTVANAGFLWRGSLRKGNREHRTVQLFVDAVDATLQFDPAWPPLTSLQASVHVDDGRTWGVGDSARIHDADVRDLRVRVVPRPEKTALLSVRGELTGDARDGRRLLVESPLADLTAHTFDDWRMAGPIHGSIGLDLLVGRSGEKPTIDLDLAMDDVSARISALALPVESLRGKLRYQSSTGFVGSSAEGQLWGQRVGADVRASESNNIVLSLDGAIDSSALAPWLSQPVLGFAGGVAPFTGELEIAAGQTPQLRLRSDLEGVEVDAPRPFGKPAHQPLPLAMKLSFAEDLAINVALGERLQLQLDFTGGEMARLHALVGTGAAAQSIPPCDAVLCAHGQISELDLTAWRRFADRYVFTDGSGPGGSASGISSESSPFPAPDEAQADVADVAEPQSELTELSYRIDSLSVGQLSAGPRQLGQARVDVWGRGMLWQGSIESPWMQGALSRSVENGDLQLLVEYLDVSELEGGDSLALEEVRALLPSMRVDVLELRDGDRTLGTVGFDLDAQQQDGGLYFGRIRGELWGMNLAAGGPGMLAWSPAATGEQTALELDLAFADVGDTLTALGYARSMESDSGSATVRLRWPGAPIDYAALGAQGSLRIDLEDGRLLETSPGALAVIRFLNFAEILRRLSLTHMFDSGLSFEEANADMQFGGGQLDIRELQIDSASSAFSFSGQRDLGSGDLMGELVVTLPVANNLPWVAALAGGPAVAAGVFVVSRVFEKQVNRMSSAVYEVSGAIDDPQVRFTRLFDVRPSEGSVTAVEDTPDSEPDSEPDPEPDPKPDPATPRSLPEVP